MFRTRKQSTTSYPLSVLMVSSTDHSTPQTGKTVTCALSKNGGAFASSAGAVSEVSAGVYTLAGNATDRNTLGSLVAKFSATGCDDAFVELEIVPYDVFDMFDASGRVLLQPVQSQVTSLGAIDSTALTAFGAMGGIYSEEGFTFPEFLQIIEKTDQLTFTTPNVVDASGEGATAAEIVAALAGSAVNVSSLVVARGVMQLVAGDKYTTERMQPFTRTGWTGEDLDTEDGKMLFIPLSTYSENSNDDAATLVVDGTFSQTGSTVTMNFPMSAEQTITLNPARSGKGVTEYKVQVRANDPINETVWLGRAEVSRGITG